MSGEVNIKIIQGVYEAFGRGDVAAVLDAVADDVDWAAEAAGSGAPLGPKPHDHERGRRALGGRAGAPRGQ